jgi:hypothetical protein
VNLAHLYLIAFLNNNTHITYGMLFAIQISSNQEMMIGYIFVIRQPKPGHLHRLKYLKEQIKTKLDKNNKDLVEKKPLDKTKL